MLKVSFLPSARIEMIEAYDWYQRRAPSPLSFPVVLAGVRRLRLRRFPYSLFFKVQEQHVFVIACFHASRDPRVWQDRASA